MAGKAPAKMKTCADCKGTGKVAKKGGGMATCGGCKGSGKVKA